MKKVGIWIDKRNAHILSLDGEGNEHFETVLHDVESQDVIKAFRDKDKQGPNEIIKDKKVLETEKHDLKNYLDTVIPHISEAGKIVIYGPAEMPQKLETELKTHYKDVYDKVKDVLKADSMTQNQFKALVKNYYNM
ncbi:hypothetical protein L1I30_05505 [Gillisia sp. M10.2A]|uniref:Host attachment protein n=1 Tax=Gillisia lutea TaxID=2909668 RepID=A0ABS9EEA5_9FLAO|nr:hypothetical protein [Gillisia lutea]MCF4101113.1 hypothetical protein [Gillisia lutea]